MPTHELFSRSFNRRELLRRGILVVSIGASPSLLAACGGDEEGEEAAPTQTQAAAEPQVPAASGTLDYLSWEGYDFPVDSMKAWKKEHGVRVKASYIGSHDDIQAKLKGGGGAGVDLITYYQGYKPLYSELDLLSPLDENKLPNLENLFPFFASDEGSFWVDQDGTRTGVPMFWGALGITYDSAVIPEAPKTYDVLFEPKYKGKVAVADDPVGAFTQAGHILGIDASQMTEADFEKVKDYLRRVVAQTKGVSPSYGDVSTRLVSGDAVIAFLGWAAVNSFAADAGKKTVKTTLPEEGGYSFIDSYAIPPSADNVDSAHAWINEGLDPKVNAEAANFLVGGTTVEASVELLKPNIRALYDYSDIDSWFARAPAYNNPPVKSDEFVTVDKVIAAWQELKAAA